MATDWRALTNVVDLCLCNNIRYVTVFASVTASLIQVALLIFKPTGNCHRSMEKPQS